MRRTIISLFALILTMTLVACGSKDNNSNDTAEPDQEQPEFSVEENEKVEDNQVVATVNGEDVAGDIYNVVYTQTKIQLYNNGHDVSDLETVKDFTLSALVDQELLRQGAEERGITVSDEEVDNEFTSIKEENEEQLNDFLEKYNLQEDAFKNQLSFALYTEKFVKSEIEATISDEELQETYDQLKEQSAEMNQEMPELEEIKDRLRDEMVMQKQREMLHNVIEELKETSTIEMKI